MAFVGVGTLLRAYFVYRDTVLSVFLASSRLAKFRNLFLRLDHLYGEFHYLLKTTPTVLREVYASTDESFDQCIEKSAVNLKGNRS
jgi:hypothetical protein